MPNFVFRSVLVLPLLLVHGCATLAEGVGRGVTEAVLESREDEIDERICQVRGDKFAGIGERFPLQLVDNPQKKTIKVLMIHGISEHIPGYSTQMAEKLAKNLGLNRLAEKPKTIQIQAPPQSAIPPQYEDLGTLRINRHLNDDGSREMLFYELTWSAITANEKASIAWDTSGEYSFRRATVNQTMKAFVNASIPDPMIYLGTAREPINLAVTQSACWMFQGDWKSLPSDAKTYCSFIEGDKAKTVLEDDFAIITHSLGSRIAVDSLQYVAQLMQARRDIVSDRLFNAIRSKRVPVFMLANQLPLLALGREKPVIHGRTKEFCQNNSEFSYQRLFSQLQIVAFSDPNDILSYAIPPGYAEDKLDSRLCPSTTNVNIEVAHTVEIPVLGSIADPAEAHRGYHIDDRIIGMISHGIGKNASGIVQQRCELIETVPD